MLPDMQHPLPIVDYLWERLAASVRGSLNDALNWAGILGPGVVGAFVSYRGSPAMNAADTAWSVLISGLLYSAIAWLVIVFFRFVFLLPFHEWQASQAANAALQDAAAERRGLSGELEQIGHGYAADSIGIFIVIAVKNVGKPSIADQYELFWERANGVRQKIDLFVGNNYTIETSSQEIRISRQDLIFEKTMVPIPSGGKVRGILLGKLSLDSDPPREGVIVCSFVDVVGNRYECRETLNQGAPLWRYFPGSTQEI